MTVRLGCSVRVILIGRVGLVWLGLVLQLVMVTVRNKDIGSGLRSGFGLVSGLLAHLAKIPQFQFRKLGLLSACQMVAI